MHVVASGLKDVAYRVDVRMVRSTTTLVTNPVVPAVHCVNVRWRAESLKVGRTFKTLDAL